MTIPQDSPSPRQEQFLGEEDLTEIDQPDLTVVVPRGDGPINEVLRRVGACVAILAMLIVWVLLLMGVVLRYMTGASMDFATELPTYLYPWIIAGGVVVAMSLGGHIAVDALTSRLKVRSNRALQVGVWALSGVLFAMITVLSLRLVDPLLAQITPILGWSRLGSFSAFLVMALCLSVQSWARAWFIARGHSENRSISPSGGQEVYGV